MKLTKEQCDLIRDFADNNGSEIRERYSGRGMYGKNCFGIVTDNPYSDLMYLTQMLVENGDTYLVETLAGRIRSDNMGLSSIIYFNGVEWCDEDDEDLDEDEDTDESDEDEDGN